MAFKILGPRSSHITRKVTFTAGLTARSGAIIRFDPGAATPVLATTDTAEAMVGITTHAVAATDTEMMIKLITPSSYIQADISEIVNDTTLTATGGGATTVVDSTIEGVKDNSLIGSTIKVVTMASGDSDVGEILTITAHASGSLTFATVGSTGFASADTFKILTVTDRMMGNYQMAINGTYADSLLLDSGSAEDGGGDFFRVVGASNDGRSVVGFFTAAFSSNSVLNL